MITNSTKEKIIDVAVISDVVGDFVKLKKAGSNLTGLCPFHNEKTPSFVVSPAKNFFKCFGCGMAGDPAKFIMEHEKLNFPDTLRYLAARYNIVIEEKELNDKEIKEEKKKDHYYSINDFAASWYSQNLFLPINALILEYALSRFSLDEIIEFRIGFAPDTWQGLLDQIKIKEYKEDFFMETSLISESKGRLYDYFRNRLMFPVTDSSGRVIGFGGRIIPPGITKPATEAPDPKQMKYLNSKDTFVYSKSNTLYGLNNARKQIAIKKFTYLVEGYTDLTKLHSLGIYNIIAPCGTALTKGQIDIILRHTERVVMIYDGDAAGQKAMQTNGELLMDAGIDVYVVILPEKSDPGDYFTPGNINELEKPMPYIIWRASLAFQKNMNPVEQTNAVQEIGSLLLLIKSDRIQNSYVSQICKIHSVTQKEFFEFFKEKKSTAQKSVATSLLPEGVDPKEYNAWGFYDYKNQYYFADKNGMPVRQSNFAMKPLFHTISSDDSKRIFEITNLHGHKIICDFDMNEMTSLQRFKKKIEEKGNFVFMGNDVNMTRLKLRLYEETTTCIEIKNLGWQKEGFWVWANGLQTETGFTPITEHGMILFKKKNYFIPAFSSIYLSDKTLFIDERKFFYKPSPITADQWSGKLVEVFGENAKVAVAFWVAAVFRDHILHYFKNFPIFNLFGPKGTGKSQLAISLTAMFGQPQTPHNIHNGTKAGLADHLQQFINAIVFIDEYKNSIDYDKIEILKSIYDSIGRSRMNMDKRKKETTPVNSAVVICGQDMMTADIALLSRTVFLQYHKAEFKETEKAAYDVFKSWEEKGFAHLTAELLSHRAYFEKHYYSSYQETFSDYNEALATFHVEDRIIRSMCSIVSAFRCICDKMIFSFSYMDLFDFSVQTLIFHNKQLSKSNEIGTFWDIFESLFDEDKIIDKWHFRIDFASQIQFKDHKQDFGEGKFLLKFKFNTIAKLYSEHARRSGQKTLGIDTLRFYLENHKTFAGYVHKVKFHKKDFDQGEGKIVEKKQVTSAMVFFYEDLGINLERQAITEIEKVLNDAKIDRIENTKVDSPNDDLPF